MIPEGFATLYAFMGLVAPGLVFQMVRERARPALEETAFREASRVALTSLIFSTLSILILALASQPLPDLFVNLSEWMRLEGAYVGDNLWLVGSSVLTEVVLACALAWFVAGRISGEDDAEYVKDSVWHLAILESRPKDEVAWVTAELHDGTKVWGYVHYFTTDLPLENRELSLEGPGLAIQREGEERMSADVNYIVLKGVDIRLVKVSYESKAVST